MHQFRWVIISLTFLITMLNYLDRTALSYAIQPLQKAFGLTNADFGLVASAFGMGYLIMAFTGGILVDKFGSRKIWSIFCSFWSIACACVGLATGFASIFIFRLLLGLGEGPAFPALTRVSADWLPIQERGRAMAIGLAAVSFASVIGAPLLSHLILMVGWRVMFFILGGLGLIWAIVWHILFRDNPRQSAFVSAEELKYIQAGQPLEVSSHKTNWRFLLSNPTLLVNNYAFFTLGYLLFFAITWLPGYLEQTYHMKLDSVGWFLVAPWLTATLFTLLGGSICDYLWKKTHSLRISRSHVIWICQVLSALCFIPVIYASSVVTAIVWLSLGLGFGLLPNAAFYAINSDLAYDKAGTSQGITSAAFAASGILAPLITGWLSTLTGNFSVAILVMMLLTFSSALLTILFHKPKTDLDFSPSHKPV